MAKKTYTPEERAAYFQGLRDRWQAIKDAATQQDIDNATAAMAAAGLGDGSGHISPYSYLFTAASMRAQGLDGIPYVDARTFKGWRDAGYTVRKGEHACISGISWIVAKDKDGKEDDTYMYPKEYKLFHRTQVEAIV